MRPCLRLADSRGLKAAASCRTPRPALMLRFARSLARGHQFMPAPGLPAKSMRHWASRRQQSYELQGLTAKPANSKARAYAAVCALSRARAPVHACSRTSCKKHAALSRDYQSIMVPRLLLVVTSISIVLLGTPAHDISRVYWPLCSSSPSNLKSP